MSKLPIRTLALLVKNDRIILGLKKRGFGGHKFNGFGGKLEAGETILDAMVREVQEECGITPLIWRKAAVLDFHFNINTSWDQQVHVYEVAEWEGEAVETEEMAPKEFDISAIPYADMWIDDMVWLPLVLRGQRIRGLFIFNDMEELSHVHVSTVPSGIAAIETVSITMSEEKDIRGDN